MESPEFPIIKERFQKMASGVIPQAEIEDLTEEEIKTFLTIENPDRWPMTIRHLRPYIR